MTEPTAIDVTLSLPTLGHAGLPVAALTGHERLGGLGRFELTLASASLADADADASLGAPAVLSLGGRTIGGVICATSTRERGAHVQHVLTLVPRAWLLSLGKRTRTFERLTVPEVVAALVAGCELPIELELDLSQPAPRRTLIVQHRESDLDFMLRLLEREGLTLTVRDDGARCTLAVSDHNDALPHQGALRALDGVERRARLLPRTVELFAADPSRPGLPLRASAIVSPAGLGALELHGEPLFCPEEGPRAAALCAERLRCEAAVMEARASSPAEPGRATLGDREVVVTEVNLAVHEGQARCELRAVDRQLPFRPSRVIPEPKLLGLAAGQIAARDPEGPSSGLPRVREAGATGDRPLPASADRHASDVALSEGTPVVWGYLDGDPERPVMTAGGSSAGRFGDVDHLVMRTASGATVEISGSLGPGLGVSEGVLSGGTGNVPAVALHSTTDSDGNTTDDNAGVADTYVRFSVPHSSGTSYLRLGDPAGDLGTFSESGKYGDIKRDGHAEDLGLDWAGNGSGVFDYTDGSRTQLTKGDYEQVTDGEGRVAFKGGGDDLVYEMVVGSAKTYIQSANSWWAYNTGASIDYFGGLKMGMISGITLDAKLGGSLSLDVGFQASMTAGNLVSAVFADSFEYRKGEELGISSTVDKRSTEKIQFSVVTPHTPNSDPDKMFFVGAGIAAAAAAGSTALGLCSSQFDDGDEISAGVTAGIGGILAIAYGIMRATSAEREIADGNPIMSVSKAVPVGPTNPSYVKSLGALRNDDWSLLLTEDFAVLGRNDPYVTTPSITDLGKATASAALVIEEDPAPPVPPPAVPPVTPAKHKLTLQLKTDKKTSVTLTETDNTIVVKAEGKVTIDAPEIILMNSADAAKQAAAITIKGDVTLTGNLTVDGAGNSLKVGTTHSWAV